MTDVNSPAASVLGNRGATSSDGAAVDADGSLVSVIELLFFAYRDFTGDADVLLEELGFGRAHHRVLHFVGRNPGLRVADLLEVLKITKQSLARVLKQLVDTGYVAQSAGALDRRERRLHLTPEGTALVRQLIALQQERIAKALRQIGPQTKPLIEQFLFAMIDEAQRQRVAELAQSRNLESRQARRSTDER